MTNNLLGRRDITRIGLENLYKLLPPSQNTSHPGIQNLSQKTSHPTLFRKCICMQESISAKYR